MGWDLVPVSRIEPLHVTMYAWLIVVANALEHSGADMDKFGYSNGGDCIPARVARSWADPLKKGISDLKVAVIYHSGNPPLAPGHAIFVVDKSYAKEQTMKDFNRGVSLFDDEVLTLEGFRDLDGSEQRFFKRFISLCRRSRGFHQY